MKTKNPLVWLSFFSILVVINFLSCNKKFDEPPVYVAPHITANLTIHDLKAMHVTGNIERIFDDKIISGIVIADDKSGQFYKTIVIQDSTGGISLKLDGYDLYTQYPIGRQIYIKLQGLYLGDFNKLIELGGGIDSTGSRPEVAALASPLFDQYIVKGSLNNMPATKKILVANLDESYQNTLIQLDNFSFQIVDTSKQFADTSHASSAVNFTLKSCSGESIILRNSSYADFAGYNVPNGKGSITAVYTIFGSTKQLNIRDTSDVHFYDERCEAIASTLISIADIRDMYKGSDITLGNYKLAGIVISDAANKNVASGTLIAQDGNRGIALYFGNNAGTTHFNMGDSIVVDVAGSVLTNYNGSLEIKLSLSQLPATAAGTNKIITPQLLTIRQLNSSLPDIEYTLVTIKDATASGGNYGGNKTLTDASGNITLYTSNNAVFANEALPTGTKTWTGYCNLYNTINEFQIRNTDDITQENNSQPPAGGDLIISEYVNGSGSNKYLEIYNANAITADLSNYTIRLYTNGSTSAYRTLQLNSLEGGPVVLEPGEILVLQNSSATLALPQAITSFATSVCSFNGNDAITIEKNGVVIDAFGEVGKDPGTSWTIMGEANASIDNTVRRKISIAKGNINWLASSATEWELVAIDDVSGLGVR